MNFLNDNYEIQTSKQIDDLLTNGYSLLPQLVFGDINFVKEKIGSNTYNENSKLSQDFLNSFNFDELKAQLARIS